MKGLHSFLVIFIAFIIISAAGCIEDDDENEEPTADAGPDQTVELVGGLAKVSFSAKGSEDPDDDELSYSWDFDATDGDNDVDSTKRDDTHTYLSVKTYTITLRVSDGKLTDVDTMQVTVTKTPGTITAKITSDDDLYDTVHGNDTVEIEFDGSQSSSLEGDIVDWDWDFNYTGAQDFDTDATGEQASNEFESGIYVVGLRVTNDSGDTNTATKQVKMNYNMSINDNVETGEEDTFTFPLNSFDAHKLRVALVYNNTEYNALDLDVHLYFPNGTEANNTSDRDTSTEEIEYTRNGPYRENLEALGEWTVKIKNGDYSRDSDYYLYMEVFYFS